MARNLFASHLIAWAESVFRDAGVAPTEAQVHEMATTAGSLIVMRMFVPFAKEQPVPAFVDYLVTLPPLHAISPDALLAMYDDIHQEFVDTTATVNWTKSGSGVGMRTPHYNRASTLADSMFSEFTSTVRPTWIDDVRKDFGP
jgi:hypothetical protein